MQERGGHERSTADEIHPVGDTEACPSVHGVVVGAIAVAGTGIASLVHSVPPVSSVVHESGTVVAD